MLRAMPVRCVVVDFDGTFTDVEAEGAPFSQAYRAALADLLGGAPGEVDALWDAALAELRREPERFGWQHGGVVVAPGNADPYTRATTVAQWIFDRRGVLRDGAVRTAIVQAFYAHAYKQTITAFRPDAKRTLEALLATGVPVWVVTNSHTDVVERKLRELAPAGLDRLKVMGDARKYIVTETQASDARFAALPQTVALPGLPRAVAPRRGHYFDTLARLWRETSATPEDTLVCGDIFELDLLLPSLLGAHVHLVTGPATAPYEVAAVGALGARGGHSADVAGVLARLR